MPVNFTLYHKAVAADQAWSVALQLKFGDQAGDARYDRRGVSTPELKELATFKHQADREWLAEVDRHRADKANHNN